MLRYGTGVFALSLMGVAPLAAQENAPVFGQLVGAWSGEGSLMDRAAKFTMTWREDGGFAVLTFENAFVGTDGDVTPVLNSVAVYRTSETNPEAVWLDSRGERVEITWDASDSTLVSHWASATEEGRTTYRIHSAYEMEVLDEVLSRGGWRTFATARYTRARDQEGEPKPPPPT